ncbi:MAG TPA: hypothetical protein VK802_12420, partial [Streptosporangiaceae bacterium]|nr:hypothetical protein [Streptosporangiaceae bacterium]
GLRGPRALEELAALLISTGELTTDDLRRLPPPETAAAVQIGALSPPALRPPAVPDSPATRPPAPDTTATNPPAS